MNAFQIKELALECGFELAGAARALPDVDFDRYLNWTGRGWAGAMDYLTDRRAALRSDPRLLLPSARSILCLGKLYNTPLPYSTSFSESDRGWISRYAWGDDYHDLLRRGLDRLAKRLPDCEYRVCVDTSPLLERTYARRAGLGWIGKNTCLINEPLGSWFFLGEILTSLDLETGAPPEDRCGTCTRCIEACPTSAISPGGYELDARACISYFTIELRGSIPEPHRPGIGQNVFGCDICQDVCPWNRRAPETGDTAFLPREMAPPLGKLAAISASEFRELFRSTPVWRAKYAGFLRNVAVAMGNSGRSEFQTPLRRLAAHDDPVVREHAEWALARLAEILPDPDAIVEHQKRG